MLNHKNIHLSNDYLVFFTLGDGYTKENKTQFLSLLNIRSTWRETYKQILYKVM